MTVQEFPLAWRWTQPAHAVLPAEVLADIHPLSAAEAAGVCGVAPAVGGSVFSHLASDSEEVRRWFCRVQPDSHARIYICWSEDLVVTTTWDIFTGYWDDFCYPSSDTVTVVPVSGTWRLVYHHYEQFDFITRPA